MLTIRRQNSMVFRQCTIGGKAYKGDPDARDDEDTSEKEPSFTAEEKQENAQNAQSVTFPQPPAESESTSVTLLAGNVPPITQSDDTTVAATPSPLQAEQVKLSHGVLGHFRDQTLKQDLQAAVSAEPSSENAQMARTLNGFFVVLSLCHTVLTSVDPHTGKIEYKAQSPDEAALVQAAADVGFVFLGRDHEILSLQTPFSGDVEKYELLNVLEFTSARKRMSVVVRRKDGNDNRLFLLTKGADNVIYERLKAGGDELKDTTEKHLDEFASEGLRTLTLAYKVVPGE
jgi:phospholipid-translocating ATPase